MTLCDVCGRSVIGPRCGGTDDRVFWCTLDPGHEGSHESEDISYLCHTRGVDDCYHLGYERVRAEAEGLRRERAAGCAYCGCTPNDSAYRRASKLHSAAIGAARIAVGGSGGVSLLAESIAADKEKS